MGLNKCKLGEHIELREVTNDNLQFGPDDVRGVNNLKLLMPTKADINGRDLTKFQIVYPGEFVFNHRTSRNGSKFSIAYNDTDKPVICTEDYVVFRIKESSKHILIPEWLYMYFNRPEFDRYVITNSWGSSTEFYNWEDICAVGLALPPFPVQQKYVDIYKAMVANQEAYERGLEDLKLVIESQLERYKHEAEKIRIGDFTREIDIKNSDGKIKEVQGVNKDKVFMPTVASGEDLTKYKCVPPNHFACNFMHVGRDIALPIALNNGKSVLLVSPAYCVYSVDEDTVLAKYILMWLTRDEIERYAWFLCDSSVRSGLEKNRFLDIEIPFISKPEQGNLVTLHKALISRRKINDRLKKQIKDICPILITGSLEEGNT